MLIILAVVGFILFVVFTGFIASLCVAASRTAPSPPVSATSHLDKVSLRRLKAIRTPGSARRVG